MESFTESNYLLLFRKCNKIVLNVILNSTVIAGKGRLNHFDCREMLDEQRTGQFN